jgi:protein-tyrosine phosphatase
VSESSPGLLGRIPTRERKPPSARDWERASVLEPRAGPRVPELVSDGAALAFAPQLLEERAPALDPRDPPVAALLDYLETLLPAEERAAGRRRRGAQAAQAAPAAQALSLDGWRLLAREGGEVLFGRGRPPRLVLVTLARNALRRSWRCTKSGVAKPLRATREGIRASSWRLDPTQELTPRDTQLRVLLSEQAFASGQSAEGRLLTPELYADGDELVLRMFVKPRPGFQTATRNPETPVRVALAEPLGERRLLDGALLAPERPLGLQNFRDVGGTRTAAGGRIRAGVLYRSDAPHPGDPQPPGAVWPPATVIDLRSEAEALGEHPLAVAGSEVHSIPLMAEAGIVRLAAEPPERDDGMAGLYRRTLARVGPQFASVARLTAASSGPTLIHCTAGKDRTGLVVAVLLSAVGVDREEIVADYARTQANMPWVLERIASTPGLEDGPELVRRVAERQPEILTAPPAAMEAALDALQESGGARGWLTEHGLSDSELEQLRDRLLGD